MMWRAVESCLAVILYPLAVVLWLLWRRHERRVLLHVACDGGGQA